jgi:plastocyanin
VATTAVALAGGASTASAADCGAQAVIQPALDHINAAHLERSPLQQAKDLADVDDYALAHTVLVEAMLQPVLSGCSDSAAPAPMHGSPAPEPAPAPAPAPAPTNAAVEIHDFAFSPKTIAVPVGTTVTWTNKDGTEHNVTGAGLKSASFGADGTYSYTFAKAGTFMYACSLHPQMKGTVTVR